MKRGLGSLSKIGKEGELTDDGETPGGGGQVEVHSPVRIVENPEGANASQAPVNITGVVIGCDPDEQNQTFSDCAAVFPVGMKGGGRDALKNDPHRSIGILVRAEIAQDMVMGSIAIVDHAEKPEVFG